MRVYLVMKSNGHGATALKCFSKYENALDYESQCEENDILSDFWIDTFNIQDIEVV